MTTTTTKKQFDASKLSARDRKNYEAGCRLVEKKLALALLEKVKQLSRPRSFRIVSPQPRTLEAVKPGPAPAPRRTARPAVHVTFVSIFE